MELKEVVDKIQNTWEQMKSANDEIIKKAEGYRAEDKEKLEKMSAALDEQKAQLDALETKTERQALVNPGENKESEETKARKAAFYKYIREGRGAMSPDERKALVEDTTGLYLVPEDLESEIITAVPQVNTFRNYCRIRPTTRDKVKRRSLSEVTVGWGKLETGTAIHESNPTPDQDTLYVEDLYALAKIGEDELQDVDANLEALLADAFSVAIANEEAKQFAIGDGHTYQEPEGITLASITHTDWTTADTASIDDMLTCEYSLGTQYLNGAAWLMSRPTELALRLLRVVEAGPVYGEYLWQPSLVAGQPNNFDGYPLFNQNDMGDPADATDLIHVVFGNFKLGYTILDRQGMSIQRLDELYAEAGLVGFKIHKRVGGGCYRTDAFYGIGNANT